MTALVKAETLNREAWLTAAVKPLTELIESNSDLRLDCDVQVSCGWPGSKSINKVIGQCWPTAMGNGVAQCFVSPRLHNPVDVLGVLLHELIHAADDCAHAHRGPFVKACRAVGLEGKPTATVPGESLKAVLSEIAANLGPYPHKGITPTQRLLKPQTTRMRKLECPECGYVARTTQKWIEVGLPTCPCGTEMEVAE